ncbi:MAG: hypothetical protein H6755_05865 [Candidatus Omnitrophica bacterium]|nr:hypothetical protein [Candidatus Omnitrophota bacterium]MCB9747920.1 hypothetical protein [Candidatus Omnitrophota bacterium]
MIKISQILLVNILIMLNGNLLFADSLKEIANNKSSAIINPFDKDQEVQAKCFGWSKKDWYVSDVSGEIQISDKWQIKDHYVAIDKVPIEIPNDPEIENSDQSKKIFSVDDGYLISFYAGEWGGSLWWFSKDGKSKKAILPYDKSMQGFWHAKSFVNEFMPTNEGLYLLVGLSHLSLDRGGILKLERTKDKGWQIAKFIDLDSAAYEYYQIDQNSYLILTGKKVVRFSVEGVSRTLYEPINGYYLSGVGGNSIVQDSAGNIYIGNRYKVSKLMPISGGYREEWIIPEYCEWDVESNAVCHCKNGEDGT